MPIPLLWAGIVTLSALYTIVAVHTPLSLYPQAPHDDGLYMTMGEYLANGEWLGPFDQYTLMKGPGYPFFLAVSHWFGLPVSLARALFHCFAVTFSVVLLHRFIKFQPLSAMLFVLLLWHPIPATPYLNRIVRETIYCGQVLIFLGTFAYAIFSAARARPRILHAALSGGFLGWLWLTREEGVWLIPGVALLLAVGVFRAFRARRVRELVCALVAVVAVFSATQVTFRTVNKLHYGSFVGVDFNETHFQRALRALHSVRSGGIQPFVSVTRAARQKIYAVSPAFASLATQIEGPLGEGWSIHNCTHIPSTCGELGSGWFMWALRDAVAGIRGYASPSRASSFFKQLADEITAACARGALECRPQLVAEMPPVTWAQLAAVPRRFADSITFLLLPRPPLQIYPSEGDANAFARRLRFLNFPRHSELAGAAKPSGPYIVRGWYYKSGSDWFSAIVTDARGALVGVRVERSLSPDLAPVMPGALRQRFSIQTHCTDDCVLQLEGSDNVKLEKRLGELRGRSFFGLRLGSGHFYVEAAEAVIAEPGRGPLSERVSRRLRETISGLYSFFFMPVLAMGVLAFVFASIGYWRLTFSNVCYVLALTCWTLVGVRIVLVVIVDVTLFPGVNPIYLAPAYFLMVCGAILSITSLIQLRRVSGTTHPRASLVSDLQRPAIVSGDVPGTMQ